MNMIGRCIFLSNLLTSFLVKALIKRKLVLELLTLTTLVPKLLPCYLTPVIDPIKLKGSTIILLALERVSPSQIQQLLLRSFIRR